MTRSKRGRRDGLFCIVSGLLIAAVGVGFLLAGYGWLYFIWFAWVSPLLVLGGVMLFLGRWPKGGASDY